MKQNNKKKQIIGIIIGITILVILIAILLKKDNDCKWCDDSNVECYINEDGKTICSIKDDTIYGNDINEIVN